MSKAASKQGIKVLVAGSILQLFLGVIYVWSVFVKPVTETFAWERNSVMQTSSFMLSFFVLGILIGGRLQGKMGASKIVLTGGLMMAVGMLATSFVPSQSAWLIYITYGIVGGFGVGLAYNTIITCAQKWFPQKRGLATGISVCMFGFSTVIFAPLVELLVRSFSLIPTFRILAATFGIVTLLLFRFIKLPETTGAQAAASADLLKKKQYTTGEILKTKAFYFITLSMMLLTASYFFLNPFFKDFAAERGFDETIGTVIVMMTGIASALGRLAVPALADKIGRERAIFSIIAATALSTAALCFATGFLFMAAIAIIAFCYGGSSGVYPVITADYFGIKNVGSNYGAIMVGFALSALFFPMFLRLIADVTLQFIVLTVFAAVGAALIALLFFSKKKGNGDAS